MDDDSSTKFIESLTKFLQSLCNGYVEFQRGVELVGHIYLNIDTGEKVDYVLHEKVSKNDENSVTFVSNSFHALPKENDKGKTDASAAKASKSQASSEDDDDDIVILDQPDKVVGSTNSGTVPSRGVKRAYSGSSDHRKGFSSHHGNSSLRSPPWSHRQQSGPAATATSQGTPQQNLSMTEVKLEQLSSDELLSLASQVDEGGSSSQGRPGGGGRSDHAAFSSNDAQGQPWVKQEPMDEAQGLDTGWSQSDSSNSGSNLYPVMMHANSGAYTSSPMGSGFPSSSGSVSSHRGLPHSFPGMSGAASPYGHPMPGTSHDTAGMDPSDWLGVAMAFPACSQQYRGDMNSPSVFGPPTPSGGKLCGRPPSKYKQASWLRLKQNPERYERWKQTMREVNRKSRLRKKMRQLQSSMPPFGGPTL